MVNNEFMECINTHFPIIGKRLSIVWGDAAARTYLISLITDSRDGERQGFPKEVTSALIALAAQHDNEFPQFVPKSTGIWSVDSRWGTL